jgi:hypothetical protein
MGVVELERSTGVQAAVGGRHPGEGTHNALAGLGGDVYLEIIAPDPESEPGGLSRKIEHVTAPSLELWSARTHSADETVAAALAAGLTAEPVAMARRTPDGGELRWKLVWIGGHDFGPLAPFFIDWLDTDHPAPKAPQGLTLASFVVQTPRPEALAALFEALGVEQQVEEGPRDRLVAEIDGPKGRMRLAGPA